MVLNRVLRAAGYRRVSMRGSRPRKARLVPPPNACSLMRAKAASTSLSWTSRIQLPEDWPTNAETWLGLDSAGNNQQAQLHWEGAKELYLRGDINHEQYEVEMRLDETGANDLTSQMKKENCCASLSQQPSCGVTPW